MQKDFQDVELKLQMRAITPTSHCLSHFLDASFVNSPKNSWLWFTPALPVLNT